MRNKKRLFDTSLWWWEAGWLMIVSGKVHSCWLPHITGVSASLSVTLYNIQGRPRVRHCIICYHNIPERQGQPYNSFSIKSPLSESGDYLAHLTEGVTMKVQGRDSPSAPFSALHIYIYPAFIIRNIRPLTCTRSCRSPPQCPSGSWGRSPAPRSRSPRPRTPGLASRGQAVRGRSGTARRTW